MLETNAQHVDRVVLNSYVEDVNKDRWQRETGRFQVAGWHERLGHFRRLLLQAEVIAVHIQDTSDRVLVVFLDRCLEQVGVISNVDFSCQD